VTIVDPSPAMLARAEQLFASEPAEVRARAHLVEASGEAAPTVLGGKKYAGVLCHGVLMYQDDPAPLVGALAELAATGGTVSIVAKNARALAVRPALAGCWKEALAAFDATVQVNGLGIDARADTVEDLAALLDRRGVEPVAWYGVRLFTDAWCQAASGSGAERPAADADEDILAVELEASRRDPYRQLSRLFHLVGARRP
jgi:SAM-dependent methyltransferase